MNLKKKWKNGFLLLISFLYADNLYKLELKLSLNYDIKQPNGIASLQCSRLWRWICKVNTSTFKLFNEFKRDRMENGKYMCILDLMHVGLLISLDLIC